jgi:SH3-like domain-containing protein
MCVPQRCSSDTHYPIARRHVSKIVGKAERYDLMRTRGSKTGWVRVERGDGVKGWMSKGLLWGW